MIPVDLITGFLGAGKTTFLLRYAAYLADQGEKLGILTYDHGAVNVDLPLLRALALRARRAGLCENVRIGEIEHPVAAVSEPAARAGSVACATVGKGILKDRLKEGNKNEGAYQSLCFNPCI